MADDTILASSGIHTFFFFLGKTTLDHVRDSKGIRSGLDLPESESNHVDFGPGPRSWIQILNWAKPICGDSGLLLDYGLIGRIWVFHNQYWMGLDIARFQPLNLYQDQTWTHVRQFEYNPLIDIEPILSQAAGPSAEMVYIVACQKWGSCLNVGMVGLHYCFME